MNHSHYKKSADYSEILSKFTPLNLEPFNIDLTKKLIQSRLDLINMTVDDFIQPEILDLIQKRTNGVPRNVISACNLIFNHYEDSPLEYQQINFLLQNSYFDQILIDRIEDISEREEYKSMIKILKEDFKGSCPSKLEYIRAIKEKTTIGHHSILSKIKELIKFGIIIEKRGGERRITRILSFG
jgi:hypothetical protein